MTKSNMLEVLKTKKTAYYLKNFILFGSVASGINTSTGIGLFGSYAKDSAYKDSDIDIVIESTKKDLFLREYFN